MISVDEAKRMVHEQVLPLQPVMLPLRNAAGLVLAADVYAVMDIPAYPQSSMDGYALSYEGWKLHRQLLVEGEIAAGSNTMFTLEPHKAIRIFTGGAVPPGADTVIMQEKTRVEAQQLFITDEQLQQGMHVRPRGSEIEKGALALEKGTRLVPAAIGFLAGIGVHEVMAYPPPSVTVIVTGRELQSPGNPLQYGQVYESNSFTLEAALRQTGTGPVKYMHADDDPQEVERCLRDALHDSELVLLTGGISVGDYDFVWQAAHACGVWPLFHKVKQRPGKPLYMGKKDHRVVFGLPGNPSSVLTCFYQYVLPAIGRLTHNEQGLIIQRVPLATAYRKPAGLTHFLKAFYDGVSVTPLDAQESYRLRSFAKANCLLQLDEDRTTYEKAEEVTIYLIPMPFS